MHKFIIVIATKNQVIFPVYGRLDRMRQLILRKSLLLYLFFNNGTLNKYLNGTSVKPIKV